MKVRTGLFRIVRHIDVPVYLARGWMEIDHLGDLHGFWSVLMWRCDCREAQP